MAPSITSSDQIVKKSQTQNMISAISNPVHLWPILHLKGILGDNNRTNYKLKLTKSVRKYLALLKSINSVLHFNSQLTLNICRFLIISTL